MVDNMTANDRFLQAYRELIDIGKVSSRREFCKEIGIDRRNFEKKLAGEWPGSIKPEYLAALVLRFGVSADWLLTGRGWMFGE